MSTAKRRPIAHRIALWAWFMLGAFIASNLVLGTVGTFLVAIGEIERTSTRAMQWLDLVAYFFAAWVWSVAVLKVPR